jgi:hypothetical protein
MRIPTGISLGSVGEPDCHIADKSIGFEAALAQAFKKDDCVRVTRLYRNDDVPEDRCWLRASGWCMAYD